MKRTRTYDLLWGKIHEVQARRNLALDRFNLCMTMDIGLKNGHWFAYLFDCTNLTDALFDVVQMRRVSSNARIRFMVAYDMLMAGYEKSDKVLMQKMEEFCSRDLTPAASWEERFLNKENPDGGEA